MLEPDAVKAARPVLGREGASNCSFLFDIDYTTEAIGRAKATLYFVNHATQHFHPNPFEVS